MSHWIDAASAWRFDPEMPSQFKEELRARGPQPLRSHIGFLFHEDHALREGPDGKKLTYSIVQNGERLVAKYYPCTFVKGCDEIEPHWRGIVVIEGPSIERPAMLQQAKSLPKSIVHPSRRGTHEIRWIPWIGRGVKKASRDLLIRKSADRHASPNSSRMRTMSDRYNGTPSNQAQNHKRKRVNEASENEHEPAWKRHTTTTADAASVAFISSDQSIAPSIEASELTINTEETPRLSANITVLFLDVDGSTLRQSSWNVCDTVKKIFSQAIVARIIEAQDSSASLVVRFLEKEIMSMKGDVEDFQILALKATAAAAAAVTTLSETGGRAVLEVRVYALEER